jgi:hypothetical protein
MASKDASSPCANLPSSTGSDGCPDGAFRLRPAQSAALEPPAATNRQIGRCQGLQALASPMRAKPWHGGQMPPITEQRL